MRNRSRWTIVTLALSAVAFGCAAVLAAQPINGGYKTVRRDALRVEAAANLFHFYQPQSNDELHTPAEGSAERQAILDAVRDEYKEGDDHPTQFKVNYLKVHKGWAWIDVTPLGADGKPVADPAPLLYYKDQGKWVSKDLNEVGMEGDEHEGPHDPSPKYIKALQKKYPEMPLDIIPKRHK